MAFTEVEKVGFSELHQITDLKNQFSKNSNHKNMFVLPAFDEHIVHVTGERFANSWKSYLISF